MKQAHDSAQGVVIKPTSCMLRALRSMSSGGMGRGTAIPWLGWGGPHEDTALGLGHEIFRRRNVKVERVMLSAENCWNEKGKEARMCEERVGKRGLVLDSGTGSPDAPLKLLIESYPVVGGSPLTVFDQRTEMIVCITRR